MAPTIPSPTATGGAGNSFETKVVALFVAYMLCGQQSPRLPPGRITSVRCQARELGYATDDILVVAASEVGTTHRLAAQVRIRMGFTPGDEAFSSALKDCWQDFGKPNLIDESKDKLAIVTGAVPALFGAHIQPVLTWARTSADAAEFLRKVAPAGGGAQRKQQFVEDVRTVLGLDPAGPTDNERLWRFLRVLEIISMDFDVPEASSGSDAIALLNRYKAIGSAESSLLWAQIINVTEIYKASAGTFSDQSVSHALGPIVAAAFPSGGLPPEASALEQKFRLLSQVGIEDANAVGKDAEGQAVLLGDALYVSRDQEDAIIKLVQEGSADRQIGLQVQIVGEAGNGKTSLLWQLFQKLEANGQLAPVFLKAWLFAETPDETRLELLELITALADSGKYAGARTHIAIIGAFKAIRGLIGDGEIFSRFKQSVESFHPTGTLVGEDFTAEVADLQAIEWQARALPIDDIVGLALPDEKIWLHVQLSAVALTLHRNFRSRVENVGIQLAANPDEYAATMWIRIGIEELIRAAESDAGDGFRDQVRALTQALYRIARNKKDRGRTRLIVQAVRTVDLSDDTLLDMVSPDDIFSADFWNDLALSGDFLLAAIRKGNVLAQDALITLGQKPPSGAVAQSFVGANLLEYVIAEPRQIRHFVDFAIRTRDTKHVRALLDRLPDDALPLLSAEIGRLAAAKDIWLKNTGGQARRQVVQIWAAMISRGLLELPPWPEIANFAAIQADKGILTTLFEIMGLGVERDQYAPKAVVERIAALCPANDQCVDSGIETICKIGCTKPEVLDQCLGLVVNLTFPMGSSPARVSSAQASLLEALIPQDANRAFGYLCDFLKRAIGASKTSEIFRTIESKWRGPLRRLVRVLGSQQVEELASLVPGSPEPIGHMIVDAICRIRMSEQSPLLDTLHADPVVPIRVRRLISDYKYNKERTSGSSVWPEIYEILRAPDRVWT